MPHVRSKIIFLKTERTPAIAVIAGLVLMSTDQKKRSSPPVR